MSSALLGYTSLVALVVPPAALLYAITMSSHPSSIDPFASEALYFGYSASRVVGAGASLVTALAIVLSIAYVSVTSDSPHMADQRQRSERSKELLGIFWNALRAVIAIFLVAGIFLAGHGLLLLLLVPMAGMLVLVLHLERAKRGLLKRAGACS